jgi:hypothetical protein
LSPGEPVEFQIYKRFSCGVYYLKELSFVGESRLIRIIFAQLGVEGDVLP